MTLALFTSGGTISMTTPRGSSGATPRLRGRDFLEMTPGLAEIGHDIDVHDVVPVPSASLQLATVLDIVRQASEVFAGDHTGAILTQAIDTLEEVAYLVDLLWPFDEPFVVTGAMRNSTLAGPDGAAHLLGAAVVAALGGGHVAASMAHRLAAIAQRIPVVLASRTGAGPVLRETYGAVGSEIDLQRRGLLNAGYLDAFKARVLLRILLSLGADREQITTELDQRS